MADSSHDNLSSYLENEIPNLLTKTKLLSSKEIEQIDAKWQNLIKENSDLRVIRKNSLLSVSYNFLDSKILEILKKYDEIKYWTLVSECILKRLCGFCADIFFIARIDNLINQNIIEICRIKKEKNMIGEIREQKYIRIKK